jgi:uncharacterized protein
MDEATVLVIRNYLDVLINKKFAIRKVYLFGSYAKGTFDDNSDIDLAIIINNMTDQFLTQTELFKLTWGIDTRIEPHPFDEKEFELSNPLVNEIKRTGIEILPFS